MNKIIYFIILLFLLSMFYFIFKSKNNTNNIFYSINDYPELKILEENYKLIASEIPKFNYNKINKNIIFFIVSLLLF